MQEVLGYLSLIFWVPAVLVSFVVVAVVMIYMFSIIRPAAGTAARGNSNLLMMGAALVILAIGWFIFDTIGLLVFILLAGGGFLLWTNKLPKLGGWAMVGGIVIAITIWLFGPDNIERGREVVQAKVAGQESPPATPLSPEEQAARLARERQEAEVARVRAAAEAVARAQAAEIERLAQEEASRRIPSILVPHCRTGWSEPVTGVPGWRVTALWGGRTTRAQFLEDEWVDQTTRVYDGEVTATRYCSTSQANLNINNGIMPLRWDPF